MQLLQNDVLLALTARGLGLAVLTTNTRDFEFVAAYVRGLRVMRFP